MKTYRLFDQRHFVCNRGHWVKKVDKNVHIELMDFPKGLWAIPALDEDLQTVVLCLDEDEQSYHFILRTLGSVVSIISAKDLVTHFERVES